ncbi:MAG: histidine phosphatase family protein [Rhodospirillales bacterium]|nr:histidine phosphatase family protein [Rhodospirillales bacterium]
MKTLYLLRHAKSNWRDPTVDDFDRPLNKRGRSAATAMGVYLAEQRIAPSQVLCSSSSRTRETLERVQEQLATPVPVRFEKGLYLAEAPALLRRIKRLNDSLSSVMLIAHSPGLTHLALMLAEDDGQPQRQKLNAKFSTGSLAVIEAEVAHWADLAAQRGRLLTFVRPRDLLEVG